MFKKIINFFKRFGTWIILAVNIGIILAIIITDEDFSAGFKALEKLSPLMVALCFVVFTLTFVFEGAQFYFITRMFNVEFPFLQSVRAIIIERYYSAITPTSIGGQPALMLYLMRHGVAGPTAASAMSIRFILYQLTLVAGLITLFVAMPLMGITLNAVIMTGLIIGTCVAAAVPLLLLLCAVFPRITYKAISFLSKLAYRLHITHDADKLYGKFTETMMMYSQSMKLLRPRHTVIILFFALAQFMVVMSMPFLAAYACSVKIDYVSSVINALVLNTSVSYMPTPGASGAAEGAFFSLYKDIIPSSSIMVVMLLWRMASYYFVIIAGLLESGASAIMSALRRKKATRA